MNIRKVKNKVKNPCSSLTLKLTNTGKYAFSNSVIIHQVKTKEITTVKEVWMPGLN